MSLAIAANSYLAKMISYEKLYMLHEKTDKAKAKFYRNKIQKLKLEKKI